MATDLLDLYTRAGEWTTDKIGGATDLDARTPCDEWNLRTLLDHMLETQRYFLAGARGQEASPPGRTPPALVSDQPRRDFDAACSDVRNAFAEPGVIDKTGPMLGIAFSDL